MKKILVFFLLFSVLFLSGCTPEGKSDTEIFEEAITNMRKLESYSIIVSLENFQSFDHVQYTYTIEGNVQKFELYDILIYSFYENGIKYVLEEYDGEFYRFDKNESSSSTNVFYYAESILSAAESDSFERNALGYYVSSSTIMSMNNLQIFIENGYINLVTYDRIIDEEEVTYHLLFFNYNTAPVTLPEYKVLSDFESAIKYFVDESYVYEETENGFTLTTLIKEISYTDDTNYFVYELDSGEVYEYYPETKEIKISIDEIVNISDFLETNEGAVGNEEFFEALDTLYDEID